MHRPEKITVGKYVFERDRKKERESAETPDDLFYTCVIVGASIGFRVPPDRSNKEFLHSAKSKITDELPGFLGREGA